jgi:hypothetical protein
VIGSDVIIQWTAPNANGQPITRYRIQIQQSNSVYSEDLVNCDGSNAAIVAALKCTIPLATLQAAPFSLVLGNSVLAKATATNVYGESAFSVSGNGAIILQVPSAQVGLSFDPIVTTASVIKITWNNGISTGGSPIIDYRVSYDQSIGIYTVLASGLTVKTYTTTFTLT